MFDRFTERARRTIFFARYEAGMLGSAWIETEHLLLGLMKEDIVLQRELSGEAKEAIRKRIEEQRTATNIPLSVDLPLSQDSKQVLSFGAEESDKLHHTSIDSGHLVLGLLRIECLATSLLRQHGIGHQGFSKSIDVPIPDQPAAAMSFDPIARTQHEEVEAALPSLRPALRKLRGLVDVSLPHLAGYSDADCDKRLKRRPWTRKEALGHLVDYASSHQQWFARALTEPRIDVLSYPQDDWVAAQHYQDFSWQDLMELWGLLNGLLIHVLTRIPEEKLKTPCRIGVEVPIPLSTLVTQYVHYCEDVAGQILARL
jgi:hypothetical protein